MPASKLEIEIKLRVPDVAAARQRLRRLRARLLHRVHERNALFDTPENALGRSGRLLRIRYESKSRRNAGTLAVGRGHSEALRERGLLTFKTMAEGGRYKARHEIELAIDHPGRAEQILEGLGFRVWFRYEKFRATYRLPGLARLLVELDETPIGHFFELEGPRQAIDTAARRLGYTPEDYLTASYYELFLESRDRLGLPTQAMLFRV